MTKTHLTAEKQDEGGGFYAPRGTNNEIDETLIIWVSPDEPIPEGYIHVREAQKDYLGAWLIYFLNRNSADPFEFYFEDRKIITAMAPGSHYITPSISLTSSDEKPECICIKVNRVDNESIIYINPDSLYMSINFHKDKSSITYDRNKLNSIVLKIKNIKSGRYEILYQNNDYIICLLDV